MHYKIFIILLFFLNSCSAPDMGTREIFKKQDANNIFVNKGFGLMYEDNLFKNKEITKKIDDRSLIIFQKILKKIRK